METKKILNFLGYKRTNISHRNTGMGILSTRVEGVITGTVEENIFVRTF
jgi:hypothetical protein